jgi:hypothetical protein
MTPTGASPRHQGAFGYHVFESRRPTSAVGTFVDTSPGFRLADTPDYDPVEES